MEIKMWRYDKERWIVEMCDKRFTYHLVPSSKEIAEINKAALISFLNLQCDGKESFDEPGDCNMPRVSGSASASETDPQIDYHLRRVKAVNHYIKDKGNLTARVFLRATGAINNHDGTYTIQEQDIKAWFEAGSHLTAFTEYDTM